MKTKRFPSVFAVVLAAAGFLPLSAATDSRLAGYWASAPGEADQAGFSFSLLGKWTIVTQHWTGGERSTPDLKVRYTTTTEGNKGVLAADEKLDDKPDAPHSIGYEIAGGTLILTFDGTSHAGKYHLVKSAPPAAAPGLLSIAPPRPAPRPAVLPPPPPATMEMLFGNWGTTPDDPVQATLFLNRSKTADVKINQQWIMGDKTSSSQNGDYTVSVEGGHGMLTKVKPDFEGSLLPLKLGYALEGDALIISVPDGIYYGQHRLVRKSVH